MEPKVPNKHFANDAVETTRDGIINSISGDFEAEDKASRCDVTKGLAASLGEKYGKPRGKGGFGEWYSFRDVSGKVYKGVRLYANRCRRGIYSIRYRDDNARMAAERPPRSRRRPRVCKPVSEADVGMGECDPPDAAASSRCE